MLLEAERLLAPLRLPHHVLQQIMKSGVAYDAARCSNNPVQWYRDMRELGPRNKYLHPAAASQEIGWAYVRISFVPTSPLT